MSLGPLCDPKSEEGLKFAYANKEKLRFFSGGNSKKNSNFEYRIFEENSARSAEKFFLLNKH